MTDIAACRTAHSYFGVYLVFEVYRDDVEKDSICLVCLSIAVLSKHISFILSHHIIYGSGVLDLSIEDGL